ncbi:MAG: PL29 family lyase N-terminal domain-containing protein [Rikenellaceae bacterium]
MKRIFKTTAAIALSVATLVGCSTIDELRSDLDDLTARVESLEDEVSLINENMESLNALLADNVAIKSVEIGDDMITFTLSNGGEYTVYKYITETYNVPSVSVDSNGYWIVSYDGGDTWSQVLDSNGDPIYAGGTDGASPSFSVDSDGYWMVSYDGGTAVYVLDSDGNKVSALGQDGYQGEDGDAFFQDAEVEDGYLVLTLSDGTVVSVPISAFTFEIIVASDGLQYFTYEQVQTFEVNQVDVAEASITAPYGWSVELSETLLTITAPVDTRATASTETDIAITAVSSNGFATIAKIQVAVVDALPSPSITSVTADSATATSSTISFTISGLTEATEWYYIALKSTESAPAAATVVLNGTKVDAAVTSAVASSLSDNTSYIIYAVACSGSVTGDVVASSAVATLEMVDPYSTTGYSVEGCTGSAGSTTTYTYDSTTENVVMLDGTDGNNTISSNGIYFLTSTDPDTEYTISSGPYQRLVVIGNNRDFKSKVNIETFINFGGDVVTNEGIVMFNLDIAQTSEPSISCMFAINYESSIYNNLIIEGSTITPYEGITAIMNFARSNSGIRNLAMRDNIIYFPTSSAETTVRISTSIKTVDLSALQSYVVENNVIYSDYNTNMFLIEVNDVITDDAVISITNNSIINCFGNNSFFEVAAFKSLEFTKNIVSVQDGGSTTVCNICRVKNANSDQATEWSAWSESISIDDIIDVSDNKFYAGGGSFTWRTSHGSADLVPDPNTIFANESVDPFDGGTYNTSTYTFIPAAAYTGYGASDIW